MIAPDAAICARALSCLAARRLDEPIES